MEAVCPLKEEESFRKFTFRLHRPESTDGHRVEQTQ
jgi:hypothetical protein